MIFPAQETHLSAIPKNTTGICHGYKAHITTDANGVIKDYRFDTARVYESQHIVDLIENEHHSVFANSACMVQKHKTELEGKGIFCGVIQRKVCGQKELTSEQKWHKWEIRLPG